MKTRIDSDECIACGLCPDIAPEVFEMGDDVAVTKVEEVPAEHEDDVREAAENCPTEAIIVVD